MLRTTVRGLLYSAIVRLVFIQHYKVSINASSIYIILQVNSQARKEMPYEFNVYSLQL